MIPLVALVLPVIILMTAFAVDLGRQRDLRRTMQARADVVSLDLVREIRGRPTCDVVADPAVMDALIASAARNDLDPLTLTVTWGTNDGGTFTAHAPDDCARVPNAVQVLSSDEVDYAFQPGSGAANRDAVSSVDEIAGFQLGTRLASVNTTQSQLLNGLLNDVLGTNLALSAVSYEGLVGTGLNLGDLALALGLGSPDELLTTTVFADEFFLASADVLANQGDLAAAQVFDAIATQVDSNLVVPVGDMVLIEQGGSTAALAAALDSFNLLSATVFAINGDQTISIPGLTLGIPGVTTTTLALAVIERPRIAFGRVGTSITTQQVDITLTNSIDLPIPVLGLAGARVRGDLPVTITAAGGRGTLTDIDCGTPAISVGVVPQPINSRVRANLDVLANVFLLGNIPVARVNLDTNVPADGTSNGGTFEHTVDFLPPVGSGTMITAPATSLGLGNAQIVGANVTALGVIALPLGGLVGAINSVVLTPVLSALDDLLSNELARALGLNLGGADIGALNMTCSGVNLVR